LFSDTDLELRGLCEISHRSIVAWSVIIVNTHVLTRSSPASLRIRRKPPQAAASLRKPPQAAATERSRTLLIHTHR
jgi:hypothetical protein